MCALVEFQVYLDAIHRCSEEPKTEGPLAAGVSLLNLAPAIGGASRRGHEDNVTTAAERVARLQASAAAFRVIHRHGWRAHLPRSAPHPASGQAVCT
jgi:hypothetical protein